MNSIAKSSLLIIALFFTSNVIFAQVAGAGGDDYVLKETTETKAIYVKPATLKVEVPQTKTVLRKIRKTKKQITAIRSKEN